MTFLKNTLCAFFIIYTYTALAQSNFEMNDIFDLRYADEIQLSPDGKQIVYRRMGVLQAHPDLAGKLAQAKRLTASSTAEQASAGLDALTDAERQQFTALNTAYVEKHGFPFIIAVRDNTKASILAAFQQRVANDTETEFATACAQVERIARLRLEDML